MRSRAEEKTMEISLYKTAGAPCGKRGGQRERANLYRQHPLDYSVVNHQKPDEEISDPTVTPVKRYTPVSQTVLFFDGVPALGSPFFRFLYSPHIIVEVLGGGCSRPLKNPSRILPTTVLQHPFPWFPLPRLFVVWLWGPPCPSRFLFPVFVWLPLLSKGLLVVRFLATC